MSSGRVTARMTAVATTTAPVRAPAAHPAEVNRPNMVSVGTIVWLSSELMFFAALFAMYFTLRSVEGQTVWDQGNSLLNVPFSTVNTLVLVPRR